MRYENNTDEYLVDKLYDLADQSFLVVSSDLDDFYDEVREVKSEILKRMKSV